MQAGNFEDFHPLALFLFFLYVLLFTMFTKNPIVVLISLIGSYVAIGISLGLKRLLSGLRFSLPVFILTVLFNPLFNHRGVTKLFKLPTGNYVTLEALLYGLLAGAMFVAIINWFSVFNQVFGSDKVLYIVGRLSPGLALVLSMTLRFVPEFTDKAKEIIRSQSMLVPRKDSLSGKIKFAMLVTSCLISQAIEGGQLKARSMKSRGFGSVKRRTSYHLFKFKVRDLTLIVLDTCMIIALILLSVKGTIDYWFYPVLYGELFSGLAFVSYGLWTLLLLSLVFMSVKILKEVRGND